MVLAAYHGPGAHQHYESLRAVPNLNIASIRECPIDAARSYLLQVGMEKTTCQVFVFIDSDIAFEREGYEQIVSVCLETKAVVSGCYLTKSLDGHQSVAGLLQDTSLKLDFFAAGELYPARIVPLGFTAIHRSAVEKMIASGQVEQCTFFRGGDQQLAAYPLFMPMVHGGVYQMEDSAFSLRALAAGVDLYFDTRPRLWHLGQHSYRVTDIKTVSMDYLSCQLELAPRPAPVEPAP